MTEEDDNIIEIDADEIDSIELTRSNPEGNIEWSSDRPRQSDGFEFSFEVEAPPRDIERLFGPKSVDLKGDLPKFVDGEYQPCSYCDGDSFVEVGYYEDHLRDEHGLEP